MTAIRRQAERTDWLESLRLYHSLAGGTGSGLGARLLTEMRDNFGSKLHFSTISIWPNSRGETPLQYYNTCMSLATLQEHADSILNFYNDALFT